MYCILIIKVSSNFKQPAEENQFLMIYIKIKKY